uniref:MADF domain-containing protein n=1 Tax=Cacopsylla melanoneura TaxID=428564 RepID=A0A8D9F6E7_9HEMI
MDSDWNDNLVIDFLELYRDHPVLWDTSDRNHKLKHKVHDAWCRISATMGKPVSELKGKKKCLMATFRSLLKKKKASMVPGAGAEDIYEPVWYAYALMESFLGKMYDIDSIEDTMNTEDLCEEASSTYTSYTAPSVPTSDRGEVFTSPLFPLSSSDEASDLLVQVEEQEERRREEGRAGEDEVISTAKTRSTHTKQLKRPREYYYLPDPYHNVREAVAKFVEQKYGNSIDSLHKKKKEDDILHKEKKEDDDECDLYGKLIAKKLRKYPDNMRDKIMYQIDGLLLNNFPRSHRPPNACPQSNDLSDVNETSSPNYSTAPSPTTLSSAPSPE